MSVVNNGIDSSMINIDNLHKISKDKLERRYEIYEKILMKCHSRIKATAKLNNNMNLCFYSIPKYIFGVPLYDSKSCVLYLISSLLKNGFDVRYTHPNLLFISWMGKTNNHRLALTAGSGIYDENSRIIETEKEFKSIDSYKPTGNLVYNTKLNDIDRRLFNLGQYNN